MEANKTKKLKEVLQNIKLVTPEDQNLKQLCKTLIDEHEELRRNWEIEKTLRLKAEEDLAKKEKLADERLEELTKARYEEVKWKNKFYQIKTAAVVRCEIEHYQAFLPSDFKFNDNDLSAKKTEADKEEEKWRQMWEVLLLNSEHDFVVSLRKTFFIHWLERNACMQFQIGQESYRGTSERENFNSILKDFVKKNYDGMPDCIVIQKKIEFLFGNKKMQENYRFERAFIVGPQLEDTQWLREIFCKAATRIANLHREVVQTINANFLTKFEPGEAIPTEYKFSTDIRFQACIEALLVNHV